jgi:hypothetical protein
LTTGLDGGGSRDATVHDTRVLLSMDDTFRAHLQGDRSRWSIGATLQLVQLLAILAAGCWGYFTYATFNRESNRLGLEAARAHLKHATLELQQARLDIEKTSADVQKLQQTPVTTREEIYVTSLIGSQNYYLVRYHYSFTNDGQKPIAIGPLMAESFVARPPILADGALIINNVGDPGPLRWEVVARQGFIASEVWSPGLNVVNNGDTAIAQRGGGGTGTLDAGETTENTIRLLVHGKPTDFIGFRVRYGINGGTTPSNRQRLRELRPLGFSDRRQEG